MKVKILIMKLVSASGRARKRALASLFLSRKRKEDFNRAKHALSKVEGLIQTVSGVLTWTVRFLDPQAGTPRSG